MMLGWALGFGTRVVSDVLPWLLAAGLDTGDVVDPSGTGTGDTNISWQGYASLESDWWAYWESQDGLLSPMCLAVGRMEVLPLSGQHVHG